MMTPFVITSNQILEEDTMEPLISIPEEDIDSEVDQESDDEELVIPKTARRMPERNRPPWIISHPMRKRSYTNGSLSATPLGVRSPIMNRSPR
jgi:hypothetical protein